MTWLSIFLLLAAMFPGPAQAEDIDLIMGSWRTEDIPQMRTILDAFTRDHPHIRVIYDPTPAPDYDAALKAQLAGGTGPDVMYLRSFSVSRALFESGFLEPLDDLPLLRQNFSPARLAPWSSPDALYGLPMIATAHGIYYNRDLFARLGLSRPETWADLLAAARAIRDAGVIPLANASGEPWTINEIVFYNIAPNFLGGVRGRQDYLAGRRCFNDPAMVAAFQAVADLAPFLPPNQHLLTYADSQQLFAQGKAGMWFGGSWDIPFFRQNITDFAWGVFAPPPPAGQPPRLTFHLDAGIGINAASRHKDAARTLVTWMARHEFGQLLGDTLPGFFPLHSSPPELHDPHAAEFFALTRGRETDIRFVWDQLRDGRPSAYDLTEKAAVEVINGRMTPAQAADGLQRGLETWYRPAMTCGLE